jgi:hypothetical protein
MYIKMDPFSEAFQETWDLWTTYLWEVMHFRYNHLSEQAALNELVDVSEGDEVHAKRLVNRSISRNWRGFYKFHNPAKDEQNGKPAKKKATGRATPDDLYAAYIKPTGTEG